MTQWIFLCFGSVYPPVRQRGNIGLENVRAQSEELAAKWVGGENMESGGALADTGMVAAMDKTTKKNVVLLVFGVFFR